MRYFIQYSVFYDPLQGVLRSATNDEDCVQLTRTASELLITLLDHRDVMSRDAVLEKVWGSHGGAGSHNNLNQYLSILRRAFRQYGLDDIILTIPRVGIQLNPDINVERIYDGNNTQLNHSANRITIDSFSTSPEHQPTLSQHKKQTSRSGYFSVYFKYIVPGALLLSLSAFMLIYILYEHQFLASPFISSLPVAGCRVNALEDVSEQAKAIISGDFLRVKDGLALHCDTQHQFMFYYDARINDSGLGKTLLAQCTARGSNPNGFCNNYFFYNWR
ncbi:winged helix-turn-helix domain-containing protein [Klebsiella sp. B345]|uniref:winged helix-turn-helix domain-containing protein n=1 Tax=Klebsiella sp. B345 TaxID=2755398 RepID=UPI003DA9ACB1